MSEIEEKDDNSTEKLSDELANEQVNNVTRSHDDNVKDEIIKEDDDDVVSLLRSQLDILKSINDILESEEDEGEIYKIDDTATTTIASVDLIRKFKHGIKGYTIINDGDNDIYITHNLTGKTIKDSADFDLTLRFHRVLSGEEYIVKYNANVVYNISYITSTGSSAFRLDVVW